MIILDSLDSLSATNHAHRLNWMPWQLPPHVRLVVSTLPTEYKLLPRLREMIQSNGSFLEVKALGTNDSNRILKDWLAKENRKLTPMQVYIQPNCPPNLDK